MNNLTWSRVAAWQGGAVHGVALSPSATSQIALAATDAGVFRWIDDEHGSASGREWTRVQDLAFAATHIVVFDPHNARMAFAATRDGRVFRSHDAGESWQRLNAWAFGFINALAVSPNFEADGTLFAATPNGIYRTQDVGRTWQSAHFGLLDDDAQCLLCAPDFASSEVVWAGSGGGGLYRSRNAGRAWRETGDGLADSAMLCLAYAGSMLLAGSEGDGVFCWDGGALWQARGLHGRVVNGLAVCDNAVLAGTDAGVFRSEDGGRTWDCRLDDANIFALAAVPGGRSIAGGAAGAWGSVDGGRTWLFMTEGMAAHVPPLAVCGQNHELLLFDAAGEARGLTIGGQTGVHASSRGDKLGLLPRDSDDVVVCAAGGRDLVMAATEREALGWQHGAFHALAHQPALHAGDAICALQITAEGIVLLGTRAGAMAVSLDGGKTWQSVPMPVAHAIHTMQMTATSGLVVLCLVGLSSAEGTFSAEVWHLPILVLPMTQPSEDWRMVMALDSLRVPMACMALVNDAVFLGAHNTVVASSLASGGTRTSTLPDDTTITTMISTEHGLLAGTNRGLFESADGEVTWRLCAKELEAAPVVALLETQSGIFAITLGGDVWQGKEL